MHAWNNLLTPTPQLFYALFVVRGWMVSHNNQPSNFYSSMIFQCILLDIILTINQLINQSRLTDTLFPSFLPSLCRPGQPSRQPSVQPSMLPSSQPTIQPTRQVHLLLFVHHLLFPRFVLTFFSFLETTVDPHTFSFLLHWMAIMKWHLLSSLYFYYAINHSIAHHAAIETANNASHRYDDCLYVLPTPSLLACSLACILVITSLFSPLL